MFSFTSRAKPGKHFLIETDDEEGQLENGSVQAGAHDNERIEEALKQLDEAVAHKDDENVELAELNLTRAMGREREERQREEREETCKKGKGYSYWAWTPWSEWSECDEICKDKGRRTRKRECHDVCKEESERTNHKDKCLPFRDMITNKKYTDTDWTKCAPCPI